MSTAYDASWRNTPISIVEPEDHPLSERTYVVLIGVFMLLGFALAGAGTALAYRLSAPWWLSLAGIGAALGGFELTNRTTRWTGSLVGHMIANLAFGLAFAPLVFGPGAGLVRSVVCLIVLGTALVVVLASVYPTVIRMRGTFLIGTLAATLVTTGHWSALRSALHVPAPTMLGCLLAAAGLAYIDFYWTQAVKLPRTPDNAVDSACALYLDPVNRVLGAIDRLLGKSDA